MTKIVLADILEDVTKALRKRRDAVSASHNSDMMPKPDPDLDAALPLLPGLEGIVKYLRRA